MTLYLLSNECMSFIFLEPVLSLAHRDYWHCFEQLLQHDTCGRFVFMHSLLLIFSIIYHWVKIKCGIQSIIKSRTIMQDFETLWSNINYRGILNSEIAVFVIPTVNCYSTNCNNVYIHTLLCLLF